jgi:hypothetical protein
MIRISIASGTFEAVARHCHSVRQEYGLFFGRSTYQVYCDMGKSRAISL